MLVLALQFSRGNEVHHSRSTGTNMGSTVTGGGSLKTEERTQGSPTELEVGAEASTTPISDDEFASAPTGAGSDASRSPTW